MGVIGSAKLLQALARDHLLPGLSLFGQGTKKADEPVYAVCITYIIAQVTMFADINRIASFITMTVRIALVVFWLRIVHSQLRVHYTLIAIFRTS
jgi:potassium/chloride transporter 9